MQDVLRSLIRTATPIIVGLGVALLSHLGVTNPSYVAAIGSASAILYAGVVRVLESRWPLFGVLLGQVGAPSYPRVTIVQTYKPTSPPAPVAMPQPSTAVPVQVAVQ